MAAIVQRGHRGRRARVLHQPHARPPRHRRRARARHLRRRGRAVRHRPRARRARHRRVRARPGRRAGRGPRRPGAGDGLDAPPGRRHRPAGHLRPDPEQRRPRRVAAPARPVAPRRTPTGVPIRPQVHGRTVSLLLGFQTFHPLDVHRGLGRGRPRAAALAGAGGPHQGRPGARGRASSRDAGKLARRPDRHRVHAPEPDLRPRRPARLRARARAQRHRHRRRPAASTSGSCCSSCCSSDGGRELLNAPVLNYTDGTLDAVRRDAPPPDLRLRPRRRRRPRRPDLRRVDHHLPAHRTGPATATTTGSRSRRPCTR